MNAKSSPLGLTCVGPHRQITLRLAWAEDGRLSPAVSPLVFASGRHDGIGHIGNWNLQNTAFRKLSIPMKHMIRYLLSAAAALAFAAVVRAAIVVPGANGTDGELNITTNTVIDLSQAVTGQWDNDNSVNAGKGVYDPAKWAVVFKYTEVNIAEGATVTFKNHPSRAPVVWLVSGNAMIAGTVSLDGQPYQTPPRLAEPGPGGFRGGNGFISPGAGPASGFGIGGGATEGNTGYGGSYATPGAYMPGPIYGNPSLIPLIGGSGGGGCGYYNASGGGGGGAILMAVAKVLTIDGEIRAGGGVGFSSNADSRPGSGSGGGVRLVSDGLLGTGAIKALGGAPGGGNPVNGGLGRVRIERTANNNSIAVTPDPSVVDMVAGSTALLWPPAAAPEVRVVSVGTRGTPSDPRAEFGTSGADVVLPVTNSIPVIVETRNVEQASQVKVRGTPRSNVNFTEVTAAVDSIVSNEPLVIRWKADLPVNVGYSAVQAHVVRP